MSDEIKQIFTSLSLICESLSSDDLSKFLNYVFNLYNENQKKDKEIERLNNIIDELEKCLDKNIVSNYYINGVRQYNKTLTEGAEMFRDYIKDELKELKDIYNLR